MPVVRHVALVSDSKRIKVADLVPVAAALQVQVVRDFAPKWARPATVTPFGALTDVPLDHWPMIVRDDIPYQAQGIHLDKDGSPFSLVLYSDGWSLTTSHECLEMLADPFGSRTRRGPSVKAGQGAAKYLVEVCDPCEADQFAYEINGVAVSDFYYRSYFDSAPADGKQYSFTKSIAAPRQVLRGGYLSWQDVASGHWWQQTFFGSQPAFRDLGAMAGGKNPRRHTDAATTVPEKAMRPGRRAAAADPTDRRSRARYLHGRIDEIVAASGR